VLVQVRVSVTRAEALDRRPEQASRRTSEPAAGSLKRAISRNMLLVRVVEGVLGAGIYALVGEV
jgi:hypothetical protein